MEERISELGEF